MIKAKVTVFDDETGRIYEKDVIMPYTHSYSLALCDEYDFHFKIGIAREISMDEMRKIWQEQEEKE